MAVPTSMPPMDAATEAICFAESFRPSPAFSRLAAIRSEEAAAFSMPSAAAAPMSCAAFFALPAWASISTVSFFATVDLLDHAEWEDGTGALGRAALAAE